MNGTAFAEDTTESYDQPPVCFIGILSLLMEPETGARVHYEGKLVQGDSKPRELPASDPRTSPRKRPYQGSEGSDSSTVCDVLLADNTGPVHVILVGKYGAHMVRHSAVPSSAIHSTYQSEGRGALAHGMEWRVPVANQSPPFHGVQCVALWDNSVQAASAYFSVHDKLRVHLSRGTGMHQPVPLPPIQTSRPISHHLERKYRRPLGHVLDTAGQQEAHVHLGG